MERIITLNKYEDLAGLNFADARGATVFIFSPDFELPLVPADLKTLQERFKRRSYLPLRYCRAYQHPGLYRSTPLKVACACFEKFRGHLKEFASLAVFPIDVEKTQSILNACVLMSMCYQNCLNAGTPLDDYSNVPFPLKLSDNKITNCNLEYSSPEFAWIWASKWEESRDTILLDDEADDFVKEYSSIPNGMKKRQFPDYCSDFPVRVIDACAEGVIAFGVEVGMGGVMVLPSTAEAFNSGHSFFDSFTASENFLAHLEVQQTFLKRPAPNVLSIEIGESIPAKAHLYNKKLQIPLTIRFAGKEYQTKPTLLTFLRFLLIAYISNKSDDGLCYDVGETAIQFSNLDDTDQRFCCLLNNAEMKPTPKIEGLFKDIFNAVVFGPKKIADNTIPRIYTLVLGRQPGKRRSCSAEKYSNLEIIASPHVKEQLYAMMLASDDERAEMFIPIYRTFLESLFLSTIRVVH